MTALVNAADGTLLANYEYGVFGELIRASGSLAKSNPFRFSTKYQDDESDLLYYGYRYYSASTGRWLGRDPIEEQGGENLYGFAGNDTQDGVDPFGLDVAKFVAKSFINGIPKLGSLDGRQGWDPTAEPPPFSGTPAIYFNGSLLAWLPTSIASSGALANTRLSAFSKLVKNLDAFNEDPHTDAKDGVYRLYTRVTIHVDCCNSNKPSVIIFTDDEGGNEIGPIDGTMNMTSKLANVGNTVDVNWRGWGRPNQTVEPGMQWVAKRSSRFIWHDITVNVSCDKNKAVFKLKDVSHSAFPSLRLWKDGTLISTYNQGAFSDLWQPDGNDPSLVAQ